MHRPLRLIMDRAALQQNWRRLQEHAGVPAGAAIKADGYGLGAKEALQALYEAGCRDFFVSTWAEAEELGDVPGDATLVVPFTAVQAVGGGGGAGGPRVNGVSL